MVFPFTLEQVLIAIFFFFGGAITFHYAMRIFVPRTTITTLNQALNLSKQANNLRQSLTDYTLQDQPQQGGG